MSDIRFRARWCEELEAIDPRGYHACERWCAANRSGFSLIDDAHFHEEPPPAGTT